MKNNKVIYFKISMLILALFIETLLFGNSNNDPTPFIQIIMPPLRFLGGSILTYAAAPLLILMYYTIKEIYKIGNYNLLKTTFRRIVVLFIILSIIVGNINVGIKFVKSFNNDLNAVYCFRDDSKINFESSDSKIIRITCQIKLENCSSYTQKFYVRVLNYYDFAGDPIIHFKNDILDTKNLKNSQQLLVLEGKRQNTFEIVFNTEITGTDGFSSAGSDFEFTIYNENQEVKFLKENFYY